MKWLMVSIILKYLQCFSRSIINCSINREGVILYISSNVSIHRISKEGAGVKNLQNINVDQRIQSIL
ncbi:hypothetical protein Pint_28091 [Pistacia integerrima]|uniref:Uncharacterized protein n=1 Tax=Pistacia integerrima TaxID=434235 RepID=A0ACC0YQZ3_9ROSI|nr:hypothetical protein Pint_28091 [Pistacia integerrima]